MNRFAVLATVLAAAALDSQCQLGKLIAPPTGGLLGVSPAALVDSAPAGSSAPRAQPLMMGDPGSIAVSWTATTATGSDWLQLGAGSGTTPDTLVLTLRPAGLAAGLYQDTVLVARTGSSATGLRVPVTFAVRPCSVTPITMGAEASGWLGASACAAPHRPGHPAWLFSFTALAGDSVGLGLSGDLAGYLVLDTSVAPTAPPLAETGGCQGVSGHPCLVYPHLPRSGRYLVEVTTEAVADSGAFTLQLSASQVLATPDSLGQFLADGATAIALGGSTSTGTVVFEGRVADPGAGGPVQLQVEVKPVGVPFTDSASAVSTPAASGSLVQVTNPQLAAGVAYHWQARTISTGGRVSAWTAFGGNPETAADFQVVSVVASLRFTTQPDTTAAGAPLTPSVQVTALDAAGNVVRTFSDTVTLTIRNNPGGATLSGTTAMAAVQGAATFPNVRLDKPGSGYTLQATAGLAGVVAISAAFVIVPGPGAVTLAFTVQPTGTTAGATIAPAVRVTALDALGNVATTFTGVVVMALGANPGAATLGGSLAAAAASGVATFSTLTLNRSGAGYTLVASSGTLTKGTSAAFNIAAGIGTRLAFTVQPSAVVAGAAIAPAVQVTVLDAAGNTVPTFSGAVTVAIGANPGGATLGGMATVSAVSGTATFSALTLNRSGAGYTLNAAAAGLPQASSGAFSVRSGAAAQLVFTTQPKDTRAGSTLAGVKVSAQDAFGNTDASYAGLVTVAIDSNPAGGTLGGVLGVAAVLGVATYSSLKIDNAGNGYRLAATAAGLARGRSALFNITAPKK